MLLPTHSAAAKTHSVLAALLAGKSSTNGTAGHVAGSPVREVVQGINAFAIGLREANPKARPRVLWLNSWFDPMRAREAAPSLINQGADMLTNHSGSAAVAAAAQEKGVKRIGCQSDMRAQAPDAQMAADAHHWGGYFTAVAHMDRLLQGVVGDRR